MSKIKLFQSELTIEEAKKYLKRLKEAYLDSDDSKEYFMMDGQPVLNSLYKYIVEYLTNELKRRGEKV